MALTPFDWTPTTGVNDTSAFPAKDTSFRSRLQTLLNQVKTYFNTDVANEIATKANKTQENWIAPTLVNGWVNYGAPYDVAGYFKDEFGIVHIKGVIKSGTTGTTIFALPVGYRPSSIKRFAITTSDVFGDIQVYSTGDVVCVNGNVTSAVFIELSFKV